MTATGKIYGLIDPLTQQLRYVGKTTFTLQRRLREHLTQTSLKAHTHKNHWLKSLLKLELKPEIFELETLPLSELNEAECWHISYWKGLGCCLTNGTSGGDGNHGFSPETRARMGAVHIGNKYNLGLKRTPAQRSRMAVAHLGLKHAPEVTEKVVSQLRKAIVDQWGGKYAGIGIAARKLGLDDSAISKVVRGKLKQTGGFVFRYADDV